MNNNLCILPWISIETSPVGTTRPCCLYDTEITDPQGEKYNLNKVTLSEIYNSSYMQNLRQEFRNGEKPKHCRRCWAEEDAGRTSKRMHMLRRHDINTVDLNNDTPNQLWFIDLKLGNICNLKCRICGGWSSSSWATEDYSNTSLVNPKTHIAYKWLKQGQWPKNNNLFWDNLKELLPSVQYFEITGGEPFMIQEHFELLQYAVDQGFSKNIEIHYNTNGTQYPEKYIHLWKEFKGVEIAFSIDNVGERFEYERAGAKWDDVVNNIARFNALRAENRRIRTQVCMTINILNVLYLEELCNWVSTQKFNYDYFNILHDPWYMNIKKMTKTAGLMVIDSLKSGVFSEKHQSEINHIITFIEQGDGSDGVEFCKEIQKIDLRRKQNLLDTHSEIALFMGYDLND